MVSSCDNLLQSKFTKTNGLVIGLFLFHIIRSKNGQGESKISNPTTIFKNYETF